MKSNIGKCLPPDVLIMDLCGTLQDSKPCDRLARDAITLKYLGGPYDKFKHLKRPDLSMRGNFELLFGDNFNEAYSEYIALLIHNIPLTPLFPRVREFLLFCNTIGVQVIALSNRPSSYLDSAVDYQGIRPFLAGVISAPEEFGLEKPDPRLIPGCLGYINAPSDLPLRVALIGDSRVDVVCADQAGCTPIVFAGRLSDGEPGFLRQRLSNPKLPRAYIFSDYSQLMQIWTEHGRQRPPVPLRTSLSSPHAVHHRFGLDRLRLSEPA